MTYGRSSWLRTYETLHYVEPSVRESAWLTAPKEAVPALRKIIGDRSPEIMDRSYAGSCTWLNGVYWVQRAKPGGRSSLITNLGDVGRTKVETATVQVENDFLFPLLRGRDVRAWSALPSAMILVPHDKTSFGQPVPLTVLKQKYPQTFAYFKRFEEPLKKRSGYKQLHRSRSEFYVVGNVGNYTLAPYKVVFKDLSEFFQCTVVGPHEMDRARVPVIPDHTLLFLSCDQADEAFFLAGLLNSIPVRVGLYCASVGVQTQRYFPTDVSRVRLPKLDPSAKAHQDIVRLSQLCHEEALKGANQSRASELELAKAVASVWEVNVKALAALVQAYDEISTFRSRGSGAAATETDDEGE
jgi:hypothetical protein